MSALSSAAPSSGPVPVSKAAPTSSPSTSTVESSPLIAGADESSTGPAKSTPPMSPPPSSTWAFAGPFARGSEPHPQRAARRTATLRRRQCGRGSIDMVSAYGPGPTTSKPVARGRVTMLTPRSSRRDATEASTSSLQRSAHSQEEVQAPSRSTEPRTQARRRLEPPTTRGTVRHAVLDVFSSALHGSDPRRGMRLESGTCTDR